MRVLTVKNHKTEKGLSKGYVTGILHLAPHNLAGCGSVCPRCSKGCMASCLFTSGHGRYGFVKRARIARTQLWFNNRPLFKSLVIADIYSLITYSNKRGLKVAVRLNGTSDIDFVKEFPEVFSMFPNVQFYDYTKVYHRAVRKNPPNYYVLFSRTENTPDSTINKCLLKGVNVAVVFDSLPNTYHGHSVFCGDDTDLRFLDPHRVIIGVSPKGRAKHDTTGFVVRNNNV